MSDLYQSPEEARRELNQKTKLGGFNWGADWLTDRVREGITWDPITQEYKKEGAAFWLQPFGTSAGYNAIEEGKGKVREAESIKKVLDASPGLTDAQLREQLGDSGKLTSKNVKGVVDEAVRTRAEKPTPLQKHNMELQNAAAGRAATAAENTFELTKLQYEKSDKRAAEEFKLRLEEMAANRDIQANQLEYQKMRDRRADQEYNERMERLDRKDRQAMIQNLAAGLASLGAAFAL